MRVRGMLSAALLLAVALAGCVGLGSDEDISATDTLERPAPQVTESTGAIDGVVTDNAVQPVADATIRLVGLDGVETTTLSDGSYVINDVPPGTYSLVVEKPGFVPATEEVRVRAADVAAVDFILVHLATDDAYLQTQELTGFMACGFAAGYNLSVVPEPPSPVPDLRSSGLSWTICEDVDFASNNATADQTYWVLDLDPPLHTMIYEVEWDAGSPLMSQMVAIGGFGVTGDQLTRWKFGAIDVDGESPLVQRLDRPDLEGIQNEFVTRCEEGDDTYCGYSFFDDGWGFATAVLPNNECVAPEASVCGGIEQTFSVYVSGFYNAPAPAGWGITSGDTA